MYETSSQFPTYVLPVSSRPCLREVTSLPSWLYCFMANVFVLSSDLVVSDRLTYARLIIREAMRHGGRGWLDYDRLFRQQAALDRFISWNTIRSSLLVSTVLGQRSVGGGTHCAICQGFDHSQSQCALFLQQPVHQDPASRPVPRSQEICLSWNYGHCTSTLLPCPRCHACATCSSTLHRARDYPDPPADCRLKKAGSKPARSSGPPTSSGSSR